MGRRGPGGSRPFGRRGLVDVIPTLTDEFGLMPWHFGGPEHLTYAEIRSYLDYRKKKRDAEEKAAKKNR